MANIKLKKFDMKSIRDDKVIVFMGNVKLVNLS